MAGAYPSPRIKDCTLKADLLRRIAEVDDELAVLYRRGVNATIEGDKVANDTVTTEIEAAQKRRAVLLIEFQDHVDKHGC